MLPVAGCGLGLQIEFMSIQWCLLWVPGCSGLATRGTLGHASREKETHLRLLIVSYPLTFQQLSQVTAKPDVRE